MLVLASVTCLWFVLDFSCWSFRYLLHFELQCVYSIVIAKRITEQLVISIQIFGRAWSLSTSRKKKKSLFVLEIKSTTLFIITLAEIWTTFTEKRKQNERRKVLRKKFKTLSTTLEVASIPTLAILVQNWDVVKSETPFRITATLNWTSSQHAD